MRTDEFEVVADDISVTPMVSIRDLRVEFRMRNGIVRAVNGVDIDVKEGETLGLVGESGCGKSVTAQAILRVIPHPGEITSGSIRVKVAAEDGPPRTVDVAALDPKSTEMQRVRRRDVSIIFQEPMTSLSPVHTIGNQIIEACLLSRKMSKEEARARAIDLLRMVGIPKPQERIDRYTFELSGGMRQRAMIAMALASDPRLLIADEPTTAIDVTIQAQIMELLRDLQRETGMALIIITHDLGVVASMADTVAVMYRGLVIEQAPCTSLFDDPKHPYTRGLLGSVPDLGSIGKSEITTIKGTVPGSFTVVPGCEFHPRCNRFMRGVCEVASPEETVVGEEHTTRCHLYTTNPQEKTDG